MKRQSHPQGKIVLRADEHLLGEQKGGAQGAKPMGTGKVSGRCGDGALRFPRSTPNNDLKEGGKFLNTR